MPQIEEKARLLEFAAMQAANESENPVLAYTMQKYRTQNRLSIDQMVNWLGLTSREEFYALALCLKPTRFATPLDWRDYSAGLKERFPSLNLKRLRLVIDTAEMQIVAPKLTAS